jgi:hypothetical protein
VIVNKREAAVQDRLAEARSRCRALATLIEALSECPESFRVEPEASGFEVAVLGRINGRPQRGRLKVFQLKPDRLAAFFYKKSAVPFSRDRFSYGAVTFAPDQPGREQVEEWLAYLTSGFDWDRVPSHLRRAFEFDVPE